MLSRSGLACRTFYIGRGTTDRMSDAIDERMVCQIPLPRAVLR
jgi:hypothetical protein